MGAVVGRSWLLLVPVPPALVLMAGARGDYEWSGEDVILLVALTALAIELLLGVGLVLNWALKDLARRVQDDGAAHP